MSAVAKRLGYAKSGSGLFRSNLMFITLSVREIELLIIIGLGLALILSNQVHLNLVMLGTGP